MRTGLAGILAGTVVVAAAGSASVAAAPGAGSATWRIVKVVAHCGGGDSLSAAVAIGSDDAWALGQPNAGGAYCGADVEHWDGARWRRVLPPRGIGIGTGFGPEPISASSSRNAWIFPAIGQFFTGCNCEYDYALRWDGRRWRASRFPAKIGVTVAAAFSPTDVWAFGWTSPRQPSVAQFPYAARYNGHIWRRVRTPGAALAVSALSSRDMWVIGPTLKTAGRTLARQVMVAMHWIGRSWHVIHVPKIMTRIREHSLAGAFAAVTGPRAVWWCYQVTGTEPSLVGLLRWNGTRWHRIILPKAIAGIEAMTQDGHGGIWLITDTYPYGPYGLTQQYWYHYSHGRWTRQLVPSPRAYNDTLFAMAWIPKTSGLWAVGEADRNYGNSSIGVITRYGRHRRG
jgi:hypothetical protein